MEKNGLQILQNIIDRSNRIVFFGGAGVSTASGIPDFRGAEGLFQQKYGDLTPEMMLSQSFFYLHPAKFFEFYREHMLHPEARPNAAHLKLFELEKAGKLRGVVTQNIDGLHRAAGNRLVYEIHGSVHENYCMDCGRQYDLAWLLSTSGVPKCEKCGAIVKPYVVLYGEAPDKYTCMGACREISNCDTLIVAGTSLEVEPAASFIQYFRGKNLIIINKEETPADSQAALVIRGDIAETMRKIEI